ncbi:MAG: hypothetical protein RLZZ142_438 [Verrucomicrobiota bacterium]|jgi:hypothetical protein
MNLFHVISNFPFGYFARTALRFSEPPSVAFWVHGAEKAFGLFRDGKNVSFDANLERRAGAPTLLAPPAVKTPFRREVLAQKRVARDGRMLFVVEHAEAIVALVQTRKLSLKSVADLRATPVDTLIPLTAPADSYLWEMLGTDFEKLGSSGPVPESLILVGLPNKVCWWAEKWVETLECMLLNLVPSLLAELVWCRDRMLPFVVLVGSTQSHLAVYQKGRLHLLARLPGEAGLSGVLLEPMIEEIRMELRIEPSPLGIYHRTASAAQLEPLVGRFREPVMILAPHVGHPCPADYPVAAAVLNTLLEVSL